MARKAIVSIDGQREVQRALRQLGPRINDAVEAALQEGGEATRDDWARRLRKDTGRSAQGLAVRAKKGGLVVEVGESYLDRKHVVELLEDGTSSIPPRPAAAPAAEAERPRLPKRLERAIVKELDKRGR